MVLSQYYPYTPCRKLLKEAVTLCQSIIKPPYKSHKLMGTLWAHMGAIVCIALSLYMYSQVFIEPLRKVVSSSAVDGLLSYCRSREERLVLQSLGMLIGIKAWTDDFRTMVSEEAEPHHPRTNKPPSSSLPMTEPASVRISTFFIALTSV